MPRKKIALWMLVLTAGTAGLAAQTARGEPGKVHRIPCGLVQVNVASVNEVRLPFVFLTGSSEWKTRGHGFSPLVPKKVRLLKTGRRQAVAVTPQFVSHYPTAMWHEDSGMRIPLDLLYYVWILFALAALIVLMANYRKWIVALILAGCGLVLFLLPMILMGNIESSHIVILVDNSTPDAFKLTIDGKHAISLGSGSQLLLALKEGERTFEFSESQNFVQSTCVLNAVRLRDASGKPLKGFYIFNVQGHNKYDISWD